VNDDEGVVNSFGDERAQRRCAVVDGGAACGSKEAANEKKAQKSGKRRTRAHNKTLPFV